MRKLGRTSEQRMAMIRSQASELLWYGRLETTVGRAKEVQKYAEKMITLAINTYEDVATVNKEKVNAKGETVTVEVTVDGVRKMKPVKEDKESKGDYNKRLAAVKHPLVEKLFREYAPFYAKRANDCGQKGGYSRVIKLGTRRGDGAEVAVVELVKETPAKKTEKK